MTRIAGRFGIVALIVAGWCSPTQAQDSRLKPGLEAVVIPIVTKNAKEFTFNAGSSRNIAESLSREQGILGIGIDDFQL